MIRFVGSVKTDSLNLISQLLGQKHMAWNSLNPLSQPLVNKIGHGILRPGIKRYKVISLSFPRCRWGLEILDALS